MTRPVLRLPFRIHALGQKKTEKIVVLEEEVEKAKQIIAGHVHQILKNADLVFSFASIHYLGQLSSYRWNTRKWHQGHPVSYDMIIDTTVRKIGQNGIVTPEQYENWVNQSPTPPGNFSITLPFALCIAEGGLEALIAHDLRVLNEDFFRTILSEKSVVLNSIH